MLASGFVPRNLSPAGLYTYLAFGSVQEPLTMVDGVTSLPAGCCLTIDVNATGVVNVYQERYWEPPLASASNPNPDRVRDWLVDAVTSHMVSDVPLGAFLSGGLDSGTIVSLGSQSLKQPMHTFTLAFDNWPTDERNMALLTARRWETDHQVRVVSQQDVINDLPQAIASMDQPTVDGINSWYISREAKRAGLTVALSGVGGDELFAGYPGFRQVPKLRRLPRPFPWLALLPGWQHGWPQLPGNLDTRRKLLAFISGDMPLEHPYFTIRGLFSGFSINGLLSRKSKERLTEDRTALASWRNGVVEKVDWSRRYDIVGEVSWLELSHYMLSTLLRDTDMMSMAHSLEVRVPFVDHKLVEWVLPIRKDRKIVSGQSKPLLVEAMGDLLPDEITHLKKRTFTFPFEVWLREGLSTKVKQSLSVIPGEWGEWFDPDAVTRVWNDFERGWTNWARPWGLYILFEWINQNL